MSKEEKQYFTDMQSAICILDMSLVEKNLDGGIVEIFEKARNFDNNPQGGTFYLGYDTEGNMQLGASFFHGAIDGSKAAYLDGRTQDLLYDFSKIGYEDKEFEEDLIIHNLGKKRSREMNLLVTKHKEEISRRRFRARVSRIGDNGVLDNILNNQNSPSLRKVFGQITGNDYFDSYITTARLQI
ncbi:MAG: hypothetical protein Q9M91_00325 [Candidatus Dojkabacteria bacterium]|nr:hypothetical protein [Candidatus Dojkabacteria bacterium]MDQ7020277.1 hypothetical protein [Candidatus Dojkabacteria bacterium]